MTQNEFKKVVDIDASPETVFKAISDSNELTNWFPDTAILEPKAGGKYSISFLKETKNPRMKMDKDFINDGKILEIIKNKRLVHTWNWRDMIGLLETTVTWELEKLGMNKTRLTLTHSGFTGKEQGPASMEEHNKGWSFFLNGLVLYCKK
jgi:uncharacterized protein YndB with AHSA1/START domain